METGIIKFYNTTAGFGYIQTSDGSEDVFFHISDAENEIRVLLSNNRSKNEPVVYSKIPSAKKEGEFQAKNINLDLTKRFIGYINVEEGKFGQELYYVVKYNSDERYFLHYTNVRRDCIDKFISIDDNDPILFTPSSNDKGKIAQDAILIDSRSFIESFAEFSDYNLALEDLAQNICEKEDWDYIDNKQNGIPILRSYMNQTCKRLVYQGKINSNISSYGEEYAFFNTGLVDKFQNDIYAYFVKNKRYSECQPWGIIIPKWRFLEFATDQSKYYKYFNAQADIASYFGETETSKLVFDTSLTIRPNWEHLETRRHRVNSIEIQKMSEQEFRDAISDSIDMAKKRIKRNYKTAIPQYYNEDIQFLVPLCERKNRGKAIAAMVVQKTEQIYVVSTILTLDQAYNNARLLAKPDREWLNP